MARKKRKTVTEELRQHILRLSEDENMSIKEISEIDDLNRKSVSAIIRHVPTSPRVSYFNYNQANAQSRRMVHEDEEVIRNIVATRNDLTLTEISEQFFQRTGIRKSVSTMCRKLKSLGITRKRLSLVPEETNPNK